jgi:hypothetical protein
MRPCFSYWGEEDCILKSRLKVGEFLLHSQWKPGENLSFVAGHRDFYARGQSWPVKIVLPSPPLVPFSFSGKGIRTR